LGDATNIDKNIPIQISSSNNWQFIDCGFRSSFAIKNDGTLWAWGRNDKGQLGDGTNIDRNTPTQVGNATNWMKVSINGNAALAIKTDGTLWSWGSNESWQLGTGQSMPNTNIPVQVGSATNWQSISAGAFHCTAIKTDGTLWVWGEGFYGFGDGTNTPKDIPTQISTATDWQTISAGAVHTTVLKTNNTLWNWGWNSSGQLANGTNTGNSSNNTQNFPIQVSCSSLGTQDFSDIFFEIYPNPTNEIIYIKNNINNPIHNINIIDLTGKIVFNSKENLSKINIQNLEIGIYILSISSENKIYKYKIVKN
jgi:alpha-tubulin suppressor-like RCC1 family protein